MPFAPRTFAQRVANRAGHRGAGGIGLHLEWEGLLEFERRLRDLAAASDLTRRLGAATYKRGESIMTASRRLVPVDTGALRSTGTVSLPKITARGGVEVTLSYGGPAAPYARLVHEDLEAYHPSGQAKYLEIPFLAERDGYLRDLVVATRELIRERRGR